MTILPSSWPQTHPRLNYGIHKMAQWADMRTGEDCWLFRLKLLLECWSWDDGKVDNWGEVDTSEGFEDTEVCRDGAWYTCGFQTQHLRNLGIDKMESSSSSVRLSRISVEGIATSQISPLSWASQRRVVFPPVGSDGDLDKSLVISCPGGVVCPGQRGDSEHTRDWMKNILFATLFQFQSTIKRRCEEGWRVWRMNDFNSDLIKKNLSNPKFVWSRMVSYLSYILYESTPAGNPS
jgi:hypothetical protein